MTALLAVLGGCVVVVFGLVVFAVWRESWRIRKLKTPQDWEKAQNKHEIELLRRRLAKQDDQKAG